LLIKKLHPNVDKIYLIVDSTTTGRKIKKALKKAIQNFQDKNIKFEFISNVTLKELKSKVKNLPKNTAILFTIFFRTKDGIYLKYDKATKIISNISQVPMYGLWDFSLDNGIIGGYLTSGYFQGKTVAKMAKKVLNGTNINDIPIVYNSPNRYMFDYSQLKKHSIALNDLPKDSYIINKPFSILEQYKKQLIAIISFIFILLIFIIILLINIKSRKKAEKEIAKQLAFQQDLIDSVNAPIYYKDLNGMYLGCNKAFETFLNKDKKDIVGKTSYDFLDNDLADIHYKKDRELIKFKKGIKYENRHPIGENKELELTFYKNLFYDNRKVAGIIGVIFDITKLKQLAKELHTLNTHLEEKVEQRTQELQQTILDLKNTQNKLVESEKMASLGSLVAGVAHEVNTPVGISLTGITHFLSEVKNLQKKYDEDSLSEEDFENFIEDSSEIASLINTNLKKTANLVSSFKQIAVDQSYDVKREININKYMQEILFSLNNILKKTNLTIDIICEDSLHVTTYPGSLSQIITNLIINSITHAYDKHQKGTISIEIKKELNDVVIIYKDDGKGIDKKIINKIFDPFFTTNRKKGGTGLGLNIIYNIIVNQLNGQIKCESKLGAGVTFTIKFKEEDV
jgi:PAS domain S-box-containing protein